MIYILSEKKYEGAQNLPVIKINYLDADIDLEGVEALIFTSKNGVEAISRLNEGWKKIPSFAIGSATAKSVIEAGGIVEYSANSSYGDDFATEIKQRLFGKKALFLRPREVTSSLNSILREAGVALDEKIVYETICNPQNLEAPQKNSVIIFSSPSTVECFLKRFVWNESFKAVSIGRVTAAAIPKEIPFSLSPHTNIPSCIEFAKTLA